MEPLFLTPYFRPKIWGGRKLDDIFHYDIPEGKVGEAQTAGSVTGTRTGPPA